jgi:flavin-dependent dehydrogenase
VVVGAGPAGSAAAITLAHAGRGVLLLEKDSFPRRKVCGELLSSDALPALDRLGALGPLEQLSPEKIGEGSIHLASGRRVPFRLPAAGLGISRYRLDALLARLACQAGADVRFGRRVLSLEAVSSSGFRVRIAGPGGTEEAQARVAIGAWGRWDALDRTLQRSFRLRSHRFFGWSRGYEGETAFLAGRVQLYLFPGGYCGLSRVEQGVANLAGVVSERARRAIPPGWSAVLDYARRRNRDLDADLSRLSPGPVGFLGTGPVLFLAKPPTEGRILMVGDAAGVIDPFSGEGQAAALASGILAGEAALRHLAGGIAAADLPRFYVRAWKRRFTRRFAWSALFRALMLHPSLGTLAGRVAGERLVRFAIGAMKG